MKNEINVDKSKIEYYNLIIEFKINKIKFKIC